MMGYCLSRQSSKHGILQLLHIGQAPKRHLLERNGALCFDSGIYKTTLKTRMKFYLLLIYEHNLLQNPRFLYKCISEIMIYLNIDSQ